MNRYKPPTTKSMRLPYTILIFKQMKSETSNGSEEEIIWNHSKHSDSHGDSITKECSWFEIKKKATKQREWVKLFSFYHSPHGYGYNEDLPIN